MSAFLPAIRRFAALFAKSQEKRHEADYDPRARFSKTEVLSDARDADETIRAYQAEVAKVRRRFCAHVLFKPRS